jgi:hypothetical protein
LQAGGMLFIYTVRQSHVRRGMQEVLNRRSTQFERMTLSVSEYQKSKINAKEIFVEGKMYDVKSMTVKGDAVELLVVHDIKEENVLKRIKDFSKRTEQPNNDLPNQLQHLLTLNYLSPCVEGLFFVPYLLIHVFPFSSLNIVSNNSDILTPPPEVV